MPYGQIDNPLNAFGYQTTASAGQRQPSLHQQEVRVFRNTSPERIRYGQVVTLMVDTTAPYGTSDGGTSGMPGTTADDMVFMTTVAGQFGVMGVALGAASSASSNASTAYLPRFNGPSSQYVTVVTRGPFYGVICSSITGSSVAPGSGLWNSPATLSGNINFPQGGVAGRPSSVNAAGSSLGRSFALLGVAITAGTTVASTLYESSKTLRCNAWINPSFQFAAPSTG